MDKEIAEIKVVFILGTGHCGSTLLDLLLGSHSEMFSLGEVYRVLNDTSDSVCDICSENCKFWTRDLLFNLRSPHKKTFQNKVKNKFRLGVPKEIKFYKTLSQASGKTILIDSSKKARLIDSYGNILTRSKAIKPYLIYLSRDGRAVINSYLRKYPERGITNIAENWNNRIKNINECFNEWTSEKIHIRYEDLASKPIETINNILNFLQEPFEHEMMKFWKFEHHTINGNLGTKSILRKFRNLEKEDVILEKPYIGYYKTHPFEIKFDERWKEELNIQQIKQIENIIKDLNQFISYG